MVTFFYIVYRYFKLTPGDVGGLTRGFRRRLSGSSSGNSAKILPKLG